LTTRKGRGETSRAKIEKKKRSWLALQEGGEITVTEGDSLDSHLLFQGGEKEVLLLKPNYEKGCC